jgi:hypothetical protein
VKQQKDCLHFYSLIKYLFMESQIKIDFSDLGDGKGIQPIIAVKLVDSEDTRDRLLKTFFQSLGGDSSWLAVRFDHSIEGEESRKTYITITPIASTELQETIDIISKRIEDQNFTVQSMPRNFNPVK